MEETVDKSSYGYWFTLTFSVLLMVYLLACFWFIAGKAGGADSRCYFIKVPDVQLLPLGEQYLYSVYWAVVIISTMGYGDIFAFSKAEMSLLIIFTVLM